MADTDGESHTPSYWRENLARSWQDFKNWRGWATSILAIAASAGFDLANDDSVNVTRLLLLGSAAYFLANFCFINPCNMWLEAQQEIAKYRDRLRPRLRVVWEDKVPFYQLLEVDGLGPSLILRLGIQNDSDVVIENVSVILEELHNVSNGQYADVGLLLPVHHALNVMGVDSKDGRVDVAPGNGPTAFVDLVTQPTPTDRPPSKTMYLHYASGARGINALAEYRVALRVQGGGTFSRSIFLISPSVENQLIGIEPWPG